jgi:hypothetical protein
MLYNKNRIILAGNTIYQYVIASPIPINIQITKNQNRSMPVLEDPQLGHLSEISLPLGYQV